MASLTRARREPHDLSQRPGFLLRRAHQVAVAIWTREIGHIALTPPQHNVLSTVERYPDSHQIQIARFVGYDRATVGAILSGLEARGLIKRNDSRRDKRAKTLQITPEGHALLEVTAEALDRINDRIVAPLALSERATFVTLLAKIAAEGA